MVYPQPEDILKQTRRSSRSQSVGLKAFVMVFIDKVAAGVGIFNSVLPSSDGCNDKRVVPQAVRRVESPAGGSFVYTCRNPSPTSLFTPTTVPLRLPIVSTTPTPRRAVAL